jgi:hypothetical protein
MLLKSKSEKTFVNTGSVPVSGMSVIPFLVSLLKSNMGDGLMYA